MIHEKVMIALSTELIEIKIRLKLMSKKIKFLYLDFILNRKGAKNRTPVKMSEFKEIIGF